MEISLGAINPHEAATGVCAMITTTTQTEEITLVEGIAGLRAQLSAMESERIDRLPEANPEQLAKLIDCTRSVRCDVAPKDLGLNETFKLNPVQKAMVNVAKAEHEQLVNTPEVHEQAVETVRAAHLTSFKLKQSKAGLTFRITGRAKR